MARLKEGYRRLPSGILEYRFRYEGKRISVTGKDVAEIESKVKLKKDSIRSGIEVSNSNITLEKYYIQWQNERIINGDIKLSTKYTNDDKFTRVKKLIGKKKLNSITVIDVKRVKQSLIEEGLRSSTINDSLTLLKSILNTAIKDKLIDFNPCDNVKMLKKRKEETSANKTIHRALSKDEQQIFFKYAKSSWYYELMAFMVSTGCRIGEVSALTWDDIDYKNNLIHINKNYARISNSEYIIDTPKTESSIRDIPLTDAIRNILKQQREKCFIANFDKTVFSSVNGDYATKSAVNSSIVCIIKEIEKDTGKEFQHFSSHAFRDTYATRCIEQGMTPNTLKTLLGHSKLSITMDLYVSVLPDTKQEEVNKIFIAV